MNIFPLKTFISVVVLFVEGFVLGAVRKELISVPFRKHSTAITVRRLEEAKQPSEVFCKKVFLKMSQILQENTCDEVSS